MMKIPGFGHERFRKDILLGKTNRKEAFDGKATESEQKTIKTKERTAFQEASEVSVDNQNEDTFV